MEEEKGNPTCLWNIGESSNFINAAIVLCLGCSVLFGSYREVYYSFRSRYGDGGMLSWAFMSFGCHRWLVNLIRIKFQVFHIRTTSNQIHIYFHFSSLNLYLYYALTQYQQSFSSPPNSHGFFYYIQN